MSGFPYATRASLALVAALLPALASCAPPSGSIRVIAPIGADVYLDDHPQGAVDADGLLLRQVPTGAHRLRVERDGREPQEVSLGVLRWQTIEVGLGPLRPREATGTTGLAATPSADQGASLALAQARSFYRQGKGRQALVVLGPHDPALRITIEQVLQLHAAAAQHADAGDHAAARPLWDRLLLLEPDRDNWYAAQAAGRRR